MTQDAVQQRALRTLKQKRMYESQLAQLVQQTFNMESAALATENLRNTMATVDAMQLTNKELKKQYGKIDIDKIEVRISDIVESNPHAQRRVPQNIHYEMEDLLEQANEIQESLGRSYAVPDELDEADLEAGKSKTHYNRLPAKLFQNSMLSPSKTKRRDPHIWQISTRHQISSTSPQSKLPKYVPGIPQPEKL